MDEAFVRMDVGSTRPAVSYTHLLSRPARRRLSYSGQYRRPLSLDSTAAFW